MNMKIMLAATAIAAMTGSAFAQGDGGTAGKNNPTAGDVYTSTEEQAMYENNADYIGSFFTDDTMTEMIPEAEMETAWTGLSEDERAQLMSDCQAAEKNRSSYGETSLTLCSQLGAYE